MEYQWFLYCTALSEPHPHPLSFLVIAYVSTCVYVNALFPSPIFLPTPGNMGSQDSPVLHPSPPPPPECMEYQRVGHEWEKTGKFPGNFRET